LLHGFDAQGPKDRLFPSVFHSHVSIDEFRYILLTNRRSIRDAVISRTQAAQAKREEKHAMTHSAHKFEDNQLVLLSLESSAEPPEGRKFAPRWSGPYRVVSIVGPKAVRIKAVCDEKDVQVVTSTRLIHYHTRDIKEILPDDYFVIKQIVDYRPGSSDMPPAYLVEWAGFNSVHMDWIPSDDVPESFVISWKAKNILPAALSAPQPTPSSAPAGTPTALEHRLRVVDTQTLVVAPPATGPKLSKYGRVIKPKSK